MNVLVIDVGTSSMRGILFSEKGEILLQHQVKYNVTFMSNGWAEQNASDWQDALYDILSQLNVQVNDNNLSIDLIAVTSQRSSVIAMDKEINPIYPAIMWQDKRTVELCNELRNYDNEIFDRTGMMVNPVCSAVKMQWIRRELPDIYKKTYKFMVIPDYVIYLLTGQMCTDHTYGSRSQIMNLKSAAWDKELLKIFEVEEEKLCKLVKPGSVCGKTTKQLSEITGIKDGIPVISSGGDQQCGAIGQGVINSGTVSITTGTGGFLIAAIDHVPSNLKNNIICNRSAIADEFVLEYSILACSSAVDWFGKTFSDNWSYEQFNELLEKSSAGAGGCIAIPYFQGRTTPDWNNNAKSSFLNISLKTQRCDMFRALIEGICYEVDNGMDMMKQYTEISKIFINGGMTNNKLFNQLQADIYGREVIHQGDSEATAKGALIVAMVGAGVCSNVSEAFEMINNGQAKEIYKPNDKNKNIYQNCKLAMNNIYKKLFY